MELIAGVMTLEHMEKFYELGKLLVEAKAPKPWAHCADILKSQMPFPVDRKIARNAAKSYCVKRHFFLPHFSVVEDREAVSLQ